MGLSKCAVEGLFSRAAVANYHKLGGLRQKLILSQCWVSEIKVWAVPSGAPEGGWPATLMLLGS